MTKSARQLADRVTDIREAIENARSDIGTLSRDEFLGDGKTQRAVTEGVVVIGEAAISIMRLDPTIETTHPELWQHLRGAYRMRILLTHEYFRVDASVLWDTVANDFPKLRSLLGLIASPNPSSEP